jgi:hypothetical protein
MIRLVIGVSDWSIIMIGQGGQLIVPHLCAFPISVLWVGVEKIIIIKLGCEKYFCSRVILSTTADALIECGKNVFGVLKLGMASKCENGGVCIWCAPGVHSFSCTISQIFLHICAGL